ncbi:12762_t:CDS:10 [Dentiscutata heterogama]|uniref:12762_t:CDS:1 n=1 Tax=Dentiscutata heterogama TaxID=1316150 RepID=A0ACA9KVN8_9GLOM|nr:12762_t:CDS:10 [Dentiscutata heterogama]
MKTSRMDPQYPNSFRHKFSFVNGITYHEGEERNDAIILCHGFPDLWYGWRYQIPFLVSKGFRVIAPDLRGYGQTESPRCPPNSLHQYGYKNVCKDLREIMDQLKIQKAIFMAWRMCIHHPERVRAVISICTPYFPPNDTFISVETLAEIFPNMQYQVYLSHPKAEIELDNDLESFFKVIYRTSKRDDLFKIYDGKSMTGISFEGIERSPLITQKELDYYISQYKVHRFHGPLNWYKTRKFNFQDEKGARKHIDHQALMANIYITPNMAEDMHLYCKNLTKKHIEEAGHWVMVEQTNQLHKYIEEFLENLKKIEGQSQAMQDFRKIPQNNSKFCAVFITIIGLVTHKLLSTSSSDTEVPLFYQDSESDNEDDRENEQLLKRL